MAAGGVEVYGSPLWNSWLDRDLGMLAGSSCWTEPAVLIKRGPALLRVPQVAPHLDRGINERGLKLDPQAHLLPVWGIGDVRPGGSEFVEFSGRGGRPARRETSPAHDLGACMTSTADVERAAAGVS